MNQNSSSGVADSASYSAEYGDINTSVTRVGGRRRRRSYRAGQMVGRMSSRVGGRRRKARKTQRRR